MSPRDYRMDIAYDPRDQIYVVTLPEWETAGHRCKTHGNTRAEAVQAGEEMLRFLLETAAIEGEPIPQPMIEMSA